MQNWLSEEVILILIGTTAIILLFIALVVSGLLISQKRRFAYQRQMENLKNTYEQEVLRTQIETQFQTFETISQELHDNVGNLVSLAIVHLKTVEGPEKAIRESGSLLEEALDILRDISRSMNPEIISKRGLIQSIRNELDRLRKTKVFKTQFSVKGAEFAVPPQHQMILFRIIQECLNNIMKHSMADTVSLTVGFEEPFLEISIHDNGRGFVLSRSSSGNGSGIANMRKRAELIKANFEIRSEPDQGTKIQVIYPLLQS